MNKYNVLKNLSEMEGFSFVKKLVSLQGTNIPFL
jgi:hypothetical protein